MKKEILLQGKIGSASKTVTLSDTASTVRSGSAEVFSTPMLIALMECAACNALSDYIEDGETSLGTAICVSHTAASLPGATVYAEATIISVSGRKIDFTVKAYDEAGEIGSGTHTRFIADEAKFLEKTRQRHISIIS